QSLLRVEKASVLIDAAVSTANSAALSVELCEQARQRADAALLKKPDDLEALKSRGLANLRLVQPAKAASDLSAYLRERDDDFEILWWRAIARLQLGQNKEARDDLLAFRKAYLPVHSKLALAFVAAAYQGEGIAAASADLESELATHPEDSGARYQAA